jgi:hypothetical protein
VGVQEVEDGTVAGAEIAAAAVEVELLAPQWRRDAEPDAEHVLETVRLQREAIELRAVELAPSEIVRGLHRVEAPLRHVSEHRVLGAPVDRVPVDVEEEMLVAGTTEVKASAIARAAVALGVANPVGRHEPSELRQEFSRERVVRVTEALRFGDKAEQPLRIATSECRHGSPRIRRTTYRLQSPGVVIFGGVRIPLRLKPA